MAAADILSPPNFSGVVFRDSVRFRDIVDIFVAEFRRRSGEEALLRESILENNIIHSRHVHRLR